jgi:hypothetical protein
MGPHTGLGHNSVLIMMEAQLNLILSLLKQVGVCGSQACSCGAMTIGSDDSTLSLSFLASQ